MSAIQIVCAVAVPLLWGYQFVAIKVGVTEFPPLFFLALRFLAIALLLVPFVKGPTRQQFGPIAAISLFLGGLNFGLFYVGLGLGSGSMSAVAYQLATPFTVLLAWPLKAMSPFHRLRRGLRNWSASVQRSKNRSPLWQSPFRSCPAAQEHYLAVVPTANQIRAYWWCSPPRIGRQRMRPTVSAARDIGASLCNDKWVRVPL